MAEKKPELQRGLEARHIELIALGGTIGVGLFMGSASTLKWAGPSVLLAYILAGIFVFFIMRSMGEMLFIEPVTGSFAVYAHRYMSPFFGYLTAWSYWSPSPPPAPSHLLVILVYVDGGRHLRNHRHRCLRSVLVPGNGTVDTRVDCRWAGRAGEPGRGTSVW